MIFSYHDAHQPPSEQQLKELVKYREGFVSQSEYDAWLLKLKNQPLCFSLCTSDDSPQGEIAGYVSARFTLQLDDNWCEKTLAIKQQHRDSALCHRIISQTNSAAYSWDEINQTHWSSAALGQGVLSLVYIEVNDQFRGQGLSARLISHLLRQVHERYGLNYSVAYGRLTGFTGDALHDYIDRQVDSTGLHQDWGVRFHQQAGARLICGIEECAVGDVKSLGCGHLSLYDIKNILNRTTK
ncbi:MAG: hypothetical protein ACRBBW_09175 [Cellvibrionaceae bacterium]